MHCPVEMDVALWEIDIQAHPWEIPKHKDTPRDDSPVRTDYLERYRPVKSNRIKNRNHYAGLQLPQVAEPWGKLQQHMFNGARDTPDEFRKWFQDGMDGGANSSQDGSELRRAKRRYHDIGETEGLPRKCTMAFHDCPECGEAIISPECGPECFPECISTRG